MTVWTGARSFLLGPAAQRHRGCLLAGARRSRPKTQGWRDQSAVTTRVGVAGGGGSNPLPFMLQAFKMLFTGEGPEHPAMLPRLSLSFLKQEAQLGGVGTCLTT